jgi:hypothetical protein
MGSRSYEFIRVATINEALRTFALHKRAAEIVAAFASVPMDFSGSPKGWRYGGGRDLGRVAEDTVAADAG